MELSTIRHFSKTQIPAAEDCCPEKITAIIKSLTRAFLLCKCKRLREPIGCGAGYEVPRPRQKWKKSWWLKMIALYKRP